MRPDTTSRILAALPDPPGITVAELTDRLDLADSTVRKTLASLADQGHAQRLPGTGAGRRRTPDRWAAAAPSHAEEQPSAEPATKPDTVEVEADTTAEPSPATPEGPPEPVAPDTTLDTANAADAAEVVADQPPSAPDATVPAPPETPGAQETTPATAAAGPAAGEEPGPGSPPRLAPGQLRDLVHQFLIDHAQQEPGGYGPAAIGKHLGRSQGAVANALDKLVNQGLVVQVNEKPRRFTAVQDPPAATTPDPQPAQDTAAAPPTPAPSSAANGQATPSAVTTNGAAAAAPTPPAATPPAAAHAAANGTNPTAAD